MNKNYLIIALMLIITAGIASAEFEVILYSNEFSVAGPRDNLKICACAIREDSYEITNIGNMPSLFSLSIQSPVSEWITLSSNSFELEPGQKKTVHAYVNVPCDERGSWEYRLYVKTNQGREKSITRPVQVHQCQNIKSALRYHQKLIDPCETASYEIEIENVASFTETYTLSLPGYEEYVRYSQEELVLQPGEKGSIYAYVQLPCSEYGTENLLFKIHSARNGMDQLIAHDLRIARAYDYELSPGDKCTSQVCSQVLSEKVIKIKNRAGISNTYSLEFHGPAFASLEQKSVTLEPGEERSISILMNPSIMDEGKHFFRLSAESYYGEIGKEIKHDFSVEHCYDHTIRFEQELEKSCCGKNTYDVEVTNNGLYQETYNLVLKSPLWARLSQQQVQLDPNQKKTIQLSVDVPCIDEQHEIRVSAESAVSGIEEEDVLTLHSYGPGCRKIKVVNDEHKISYGTQGITLFIKNIGIEEGTYNLEYDSELFTLEEDTIVLLPGQTKNISLKAKDISDLGKGVYLDELRAYSDEHEYYETVKVELGEQSLFNKAVNHVLNKWQCLLFMIVFIAGFILGLVLLFYRGVLKALTPTNSTLIMRRVAYSGKAKARNIALFIASFLVLFVIAFLISYKPLPDLENKPLYHEMWQGSTLELPIGDYFQDPDNDTLKYSSEHSEHLIVDVASGKASIMPVEAYSGVEELKFIADDCKGGLAESAIITIKVLPREDKGVKGLFAQYCAIFWTALLLVLWLVIFSYHMSRGRFVYFYRERKRKNKAKRK